MSASVPAGIKLLGPYPDPPAEEQIDYRDQGEEEAVEAEEEDVEIILDQEEPETHFEHSFDAEGNAIRE